jgi:uncharacterized membrane protein YkoI
MCVLAAAPAAADKKVALKDLPAPVQQTVKEQSQGGTVRGLSKEVEKGKTVYEAELTVNGHAKDIIIDPAGKVLVTEEQTTLAEIPAAARTALEKAIGSGKLVAVEIVHDADRTYYEAQIANGRKRSEAKVDAEGHAVK